MRQVDRRQDASGRTAGGVAEARGRTPDHGHLGDILAVLDADQFQRCFVAWVAALTGVPAG
jgi:hypothetical protein